MQCHNSRGHEDPACRTREKRKYDAGYAIYGELYRSLKDPYAAIARHVGQA